MKNRNIFIPFFLSFVFAFISFSCDQGDDHHSANLVLRDDVAISTRGDCEECPGNDECCCAVWLQPFATAASLQFCGTSGSGATCIGAATGNCPSFSGGGVTRNLTSIEPRAAFCVNEDSPFYIYNSSSTDTVRIIISCQMDITPPDTMWIKIPPLQFKYIQTNEDCEVDPC